MRVLRGHKGRVCALAYAPDGRTLASGGNDRKVRLLDAATGSERLALKGHPACVYALAFSADGRSLASGGGQRCLRLWDVAAGQGHAALRGAASSWRAWRSRRTGNCSPAPAAMSSLLQPITEEKIPFPKDRARSATVRTAHASAPLICVS
jgi:WD40 repeat protein